MMYEIIPFSELIPWPFINKVLQKKHSPLNGCCRKSRKKEKSGRSESRTRTSHFKTWGIDAVHFQGPVRLWSLSSYCEDSTRYLQPLARHGNAPVSTQGRSFVYVFLQFTGIYCIVPRCSVTFWTHPKIIPVGQFFRRWIKSINQA